MDGITLKFWPPSQKTRQLLVERMTKNLSSSTIFAKKFGNIISKEEALTHARYIEDASFIIANENYQKEPDGDGSSAVKLYVKECSKLVVEILQRGPSIKSHETVFDISNGQRAFIDAEEANELLKPLKEPGNSYTKICFSNRSFGLPAACVVGPILATVKNQLKEVDLSDFVAGRNESEALDVMNIFSKALEGCILTSLNLSNNALGEKGLRAFGSLLKSQKSLEELYLMNNGISGEAARAVCELIPMTEKLRILHFHNNMTGDDGALAISQLVKRCPVLENFRCSSARVGSEGSALSEALSTCSHLKKLDLRDNMFGVQGGIVLSKSLSKHQNLTEVYFSYLNLEDGGAIAIANILKETAPLLEVLEMAGNEITTEAASSLAACIARKHYLIRLNLAENELMDEGMIVIYKALEEGHVELKEVDMSDNNLRRIGARVLAQAVVHKPGFKCLNVNGNFISDEGIEELKGIFKNFPDVLGPLDQNDPDGEDYDDKESEDEDEMESKLKHLNVNE